MALPPSQFFHVLQIKNFKSTSGSVCSLYTQEQWANRYCDVTGGKASGQSKATLFTYIKKSSTRVYTFIKVGERFAGQAGLQAGGGDWEPRRYGKAGRRQSQRNVTRGEELVWEQVSDGGAEHGVCMEHPPDQWRSHRVNVLQREKGNKNICSRIHSTILYC